jgi:hypothetical protein
MKKILLFLLISTAAFGQSGPYNGASPKLATTPQGDELAILARTVPQDIDRIGFTKTLSNSVDSEWGTIVGGIGAGMDVDQTGGNLVITAGTTARSETIIRSTESWLGGVRIRARSTLSQRNANNNFFVELVDVIGDGLAYTISSATAMTVTFPSGHGFTSENVGQSMYVGLFSGTGTFLSGRYAIASVSGDNITFTVSGFAAGTGTCSAFGWNYYQLHYTGATATVTNFDTQRRGYATGVSSPTTLTSAAPGHMAIITANDLIATYSDMLVASATGVQINYRADRKENIPDDSNLRLQIRIANGSTAPTATTWTIGFVSVSHYANTDVSIQDVRPMNPGNPLGVEVLRSSTNAVTVSSGTVTTVSSVTTLANGQTAHSSASTGSPLRMAGRATQTTPATQDQTLAAGDAADLQVTTGGQLINKPYATSEIDWHYSAAASGIVSSTTAVTFKTASGTAGIRNYITGIEIGAFGAGTATELAIRDGAAGTVIWRMQIPASGLPAPVTVNFTTPLRGTANTLLEVVTLTSSATPVFFNAHGYTGF